jgi:undecaprenyl pyrophosphate phosphatase UppP
MYYSAIGILAVLILLIENTDILLKRNNSFNQPAWRVYRRFLFSVLVYYITDILWGVIEERKLAALLFADTTVYFIAMAVGVLFWTEFAVAYSGEDKPFGRFIVLAGRVLAVGIALLSVANVFAPLLFTVDADGVYHALPLRYGAMNRYPLSSF